MGFGSNPYRGSSGGGNGGGSGAVLTGAKELRDVLSQAPTTLQRKYAAKAIRAALKEDQKDFELACPKASGAMSKASIIRRAPKAKRSEIWLQLVITRKSLQRAEERAAKRAVRAEAKRRAKGSGRKIGEELEGLAGSYLHNTRDRGNKNAYYPIFIEIGTRFMKGLYPMTRVFEASRGRKLSMIIEMIREFCFDLQRT